MLVLIKESKRNNNRKANSVDELRKLIDKKLIPGYEYKLNLDNPYFFIEINEVLIVSAKLYKIKSRMVYKFVVNTDFLGDHTITYEEIKMLHAIINILYNNKKLIISNFKEYSVAEYEEEEKKANYMLDHIGSAFEKSLSKTYEECVLDKKIKENETYEQIKKLVLDIESINSNVLISLADEVEEIIDNNCKSERVISSVFDRLLSLVFISKEEIEKVYYRLVNYTRKFDKELADDYEGFFLNEFNDNFEE